MYSISHYLAHSDFGVLGYEMYLHKTNAVLSELRMDSMVYILQSSTIFTSPCDDIPHKKCSVS